MFNNFPEVELILKKQNSHSPNVTFPKVHTIYILVLFWIWFSLVVDLGILILFLLMQCRARKPYLTLRKSGLEKAEYFHFLTQEKFQISLSTFFFQIVYVNNTLIFQKFDFWKWLSLKVQIRWGESFLRSLSLWTRIKVLCSVVCTGDRQVKR